MPTITETRIPMKKGCSSVAHLMALPTALAAAPMEGAHHMESSTPTQMVTEGVTMISTFVSLETSLPNSAAKMVTTKTARGPPAPPS
ncbi:unknown [Firmicutes bacterium CAG:102]|nr:unknown [Firmicutes bacterium CAG:102]